MGPYIQVATFAEDVSRDPTTRNLTVSRFITSTTLGLIGGPRRMPPLPIPFPLVVTMWGAGTTGVHQLRIIPEDPHGNSLAPVYDNTVTFEDDPFAGLDLILQLPMLLTEPGTYFFNVVISEPDGSNERTVARIPLKVEYSRVGPDVVPVSGRPAETAPAETAPA